MPPQEDPRHNLRLTKALKVRLAHSAIDNGRSMNAEILARLDHSFDPDPAAQLATLLTPVASLTDAERQKVGELLASLGGLLAKGRKA